LFPTLTQGFMLLVSWILFLIKSTKKATFESRLIRFFFASHMQVRPTNANKKLGAGTAFESVASHYERDELPHTLPCHKFNY
jgi:hypothetical protein